MNEPKYVVNFSFQEGSKDQDRAAIIKELQHQFSMTWSAGVTNPFLEVQPGAWVTTIHFSAEEANETAEKLRQTASIDPDSVRVSEVTD
jgi:hypothetical protein